MTALLNMVAPAIVFIFLWLAYRDWKKNGNFKRLATHYFIPLFVILYIYQVIQPSYIPKNSVPTLKRAPVIFMEIEAEDRLKSPRFNVEQSEERFNNLMDHRKDIDRILSE